TGWSGFPTRATRRSNGDCVFLSPLLRKEQPMRRPEFRPRLEELEGRLPPSDLHGALADLGQSKGNNAHHAGQVPSPLLPTQPHACGRSFGEWNVLYSQWAIEDGLGADRPWTRRRSTWPSCRRRSRPV